METILASVHVRARKQAGHMGASDLIKALLNTLQGGGRPHTVNVGLRASGRKALLASTTWSGRIRSGSKRRDRDPHFNSDTCGLGHILPGSKTI